jgi:hypothetical protein
MLYLQETIIIIEHRSKHKFKCVKRMDSQISNLITRDNMIHLQIGFYKIYNSKTCHFLKIMQITPYSISNNYKLFMVAFSNTI